MTDTQSLPVGPRPSGSGGTEARPLVGVGTRLGRYEVIAPLARGGMAEVWVARQRGELGFERQVALKTIRPEHAGDAAFRKSFLEEARVASRLRHAHVVEVLDLGEDDGTVYLAMPLVDGPSLRQLEDQRGKLPLGLSLRIALDALAGLHAAHELADPSGTPMQLVHRDVSPHNVLIGRDGVAKLADFGVAKALGRLVDETEHGQLRGKLGYFSPEQVERRPIDRRSDLFSMGVILWELATHQRLFLGGDLIDTLVKVARSDAPSVRLVDPSIPAPIAEVIGRALARDPAHRYGTAAELAIALEGAAQEAGLRILNHREVAGAIAEVPPPKAFPAKPPLPLTPAPREATRSVAVVETGVAQALPRPPWRRLALLAVVLVFFGAVGAYTLSSRGPSVEALPPPEDPGQGADLPTAPAQPSIAAEPNPGSVADVAPPPSLATTPAAQVAPPSPTPSTERPKAVRAPKRAPRPLAKEPEPRGPEAATPRPKFSNPYGR